MSAVWQLWLQLWRRMPVLAGLATLMWLVGMILVVCAFAGHRAHALALAGLPLTLFGSWFWHIGQGQILRGVCRSESLLLPHFRRRLGLAAIADALQWVVVPMLLAWAVGLPHVVLIGAGALLAAAIGLASGTGRKASLLIWVVFIAVGWKPDLGLELGRAALQAPLTAVLAVLLAALILRMILAPLLEIRDSEPAASPLESTGLGRMSNTSSDGTAPPRGAIGKRIAALFDRSSQRAMERALARYRVRPIGARRMALVRTLLLPHDNPAAIMLRLVIVAAMVTLYFFVIQHRPHYSAAVIGAYAVLLSLSRFPQLGRGMQRMRPNLADLYLTLAPDTRNEYQKTLADALLVLVPISMVTALAYTTLGIVLAHAAEPVRMLLTAAIVAAGASLVALAIHLIGPEGSLGRSLINVVLIVGAMATYWGGYVLMGLVGLVLGGVVLALVTISFGAGVWFAAQREYGRRDPNFDAPLG